MIESLYWKEELGRIAKAIRPVANPKRWSERAVCTVERDVMIGFFIVRRMLELKRVSSRVARTQLDVFSAPTTKNITKMNRFSIDENYEWGLEKAEAKQVLYVCNQCIHAYLSCIFRGKDRNWADLLVVSDFDRNDVIWRVPFPTIVQLFLAASEDWPSSVRMVYDLQLGDYVESTN